MATYYAINAGGNWSAGTTWSTVSAKDASRTGGSTAPTSSDDCILDDYSGNVTVNATSAAKTANCTTNGNYAGTLTINSGQTLTVSGTITLSAAMTLDGSGTILSSGTNSVITNGLNGANLTFTGTLNLTGGNKTLNCDGTKWSTVYVNGSYTYTLASALQAQTLNFYSLSSATFSGAFDITADLVTDNNVTTLTFAAGQKLVVSTGLKLGSSVNAITIRSGTASSKTYIAYTGTEANCTVVGCIFTDVDFSTYSTPVTNLDNWHGGTLTRTTGIVNRSQSDFGGGGGMLMSRVRTGY